MLEYWLYRSLSRALSLSLSLFSSLLSLSSLSEGVTGLLDCISSSEAVPQVSSQVGPFTSISHVISLSVKKRERERERERL